MSKAQRIAEANGQKVCHGGLIFALADSSFGYACTALLHDVLTSECVESAKSGRRGIYDAKVTNQKGETVALFRGESATVKGTWIG